MSKNNFFTAFSNKTNQVINNLFKKYLNKLNFYNLIKNSISNKFILTIVALIVLFISYLSIPNLHDKSEIVDELKFQLLGKLSLNFNFTKDLKYSFFPRPHFTSVNSVILDGQNEISKIKDLKIYVSLDNLFSLKNTKIKSVILRNANFNLKNQNSDFFVKLLSKNFKDIDLIIKDSNIFYRNTRNDVLFINKIINMRYFYDIKNFTNIFFSKNKIFNFPYSLEMYDNKIKKKIFTKINFKPLRIQLENEIDYSDNTIKGLANLIFNKNKDIVNYEMTKENFNFNFFNKLDLEKYSYKGRINYNPFQSSLNGKTKKINFNHLFMTNAPISELLKTEIFNNENLDFKLSIIGNKIYNYDNFNNILLKAKIQEGLIDLDYTNFSWKNYVDFEITNSLIFTKDNELIIDGKLDIIIKNFQEIYKTLLTPKNLRTEIKKIELNFNYNFDQKTLKINDVTIDNAKNLNLDQLLKNIIFKENKLQNKIYFMNIINRAIKSYAG